MQTLAAQPGIRVNLAELIEMRHRVREVQLFSTAARRSPLIGLHHSKLRGRGVDFDQVRVYQAGDDVRILPLFISGLSDNVKKEVSLRKRKFAKSHPIHFYWGTPRSPRDYPGGRIEIAQAVHAEIQALGEIARDLEQRSS